jgi:hypothetical protein
MAGQLQICADTAAISIRGLEKSVEGGLAYIQEIAVEQTMNQRYEG